MPVLMLDQFELDFNPLPESQPESSRPAEVDAIIDQLYLHARGRLNAMTAERIGEATGLCSRKVRSIISQYQETMPFVIAGSPGQGFYITEDPADMADYDRSLISTLRSIASRARAFRINAARCGYERTGTHPHTHYRQRKPQ